MSSFITIILVPLRPKYARSKQVPGPEPVGDRRLLIGAKRVWRDTAHSQFCKPYLVPFDAAAFDSRRTPRDVLPTNRPHGTQSLSVSEPSSRGTTPSPRAHVRCVAARAPGPTEHALGPEGGHTHGRRRRTARVVLSSARQGRAAHPGAATTAVGPTSLGACGHTSGIRHLLLWGSGFWFSSRFRSVGVA